MHKLLILSLVASMLQLTGCSTYTSSSNAGSTTQQSQNMGSRSELLTKMQESSKYRKEGDLEKSSEVLEQADVMIDDFEKKASTRLGQETLSAFTNPANITYEGWSNERIMVDTYLALDSLMTGEFDRARVWLNKAYQRQRDAVERNSKVLESAQNNIETSEITSYYAENLSKLTPLADYVNPFTSYLRGVFFMYYGEDSSDLEVARKALEQSYAFAKENKYVKQDLEQIEKMVSGNKTTLSNMTYVIFESGKGPYLVEKRIKLLLNGEEAIPVFQSGDGLNNRLKVTAGNVSEDSQILANMDDIFGAAFQSERKKIQARAGASAGVKEATSSAAGTIAGIAASQALSQVPGGGLVGSLVGGAIAGAATKAVVSEVQNTYNVADTRSWTSLPATFQLCKISTPQDKILQIADAGGSEPKTVELPDNGINLVYVQSSSKGSPMNVWTVKIKERIDAELEEFEKYIEQKLKGKKSDPKDLFAVDSEDDSK